MISKKLFRAMVFKISQVLCFTVSFSESYVLLLPLASGFLLLIYLPHHHSPVFTSNIFYSSNCKISFFSHGSLLFHDLHVHTKTKVCGLYERKRCICLSEAGLLLAVISCPIMAIRYNKKATEDDEDGQAKENTAAIGETWLCT